MKKLLIVICTLFLVSCVFAAPQPLWATYGLLINDSAGNTTQQNPQVVANEDGNFTIIWEDGRSGFYDIYAQRINSAGAPMWNKNGLSICSVKGNQNFVQAISDNANGTIIVWQDYRNGNSDIFAQKINQSGQSLWGAQGIAVCIAAAGQFSPQLTTDGAGGAIITWHDYRRGGGEDVFAQRIDKNGIALWKENGVPISIASGTQWYPQITSDNKGGAIIAWTDGRKSAGDNNIYAQRISAQGSPLWERNGLAICSAKQNQERPSLLNTIKGVILVWNDYRFNNSDIFAQKINLDGNLLWAKDGIGLCTASYAQENAKLAEDGVGGAIIVWEDNRGQSKDIYTQRVYNDGRLAWQENGRPVSKASGKQENPSIIELDANNWVIAWEDKRFGTIDLFAQKINGAGASLWNSQGVVVASAPLNQESFSLATSKADEVIVCWQDNRRGNFDVYAQKISSSGTLLWSSSGKVVNNSLGSVVQQNIKAVESSRGEIILAFEDGRSGFFNIYTQKINQLGGLTWGTHGIPVAKVAANQSNPQIIPDNSGGAIYAWEDHRINGRPSIRLQHISNQGSALWTGSINAGLSKSRQVNPVMVSDNNGGAIVAWQDNRNVLSLQDVYIQRVSSKGRLLWGKKGKVAISANGDQVDVAMVEDGSGGVYLTWTDYRAGDRNPDIYAQHINQNGKVLWNDEGILICGAPDVQRAPKIILDEQGGVIIAWTDKGGGSYDIYAQRVSAKGQPMWMTDGIPINQLSRTQQNPLFAKDGKIVWEDYRFGNWDIFAGSVSPSGRLIWGEEAVPVVSLSHTQYSPKITSLKDGNIIIAWEDYRNGQYYEIYVQRLDDNGRSTWDKNGIKVETKNGARSPLIIASGKYFYVLWEDYSGGGRAIYGQKFLLK